MHPGILTLTGKIEEVMIGKIEMKGSRFAGHSAIVPPFDLNLSIGNDSSYRSSELR